MTVNIAPFVENQFPDFYKKEGPLFIAFTKAYYEWMENNTQELYVEFPDRFEVGDTLTQGDTTGEVIAKYDSYLLVHVDKEDRIFECSISCGNREPIVSQTGASCIILKTSQFNPLFFAKNIPNIRDIDYTIDAFILSFKNKYLPDVQFNIASNKELFIKNALDFYRAKGTERAIDLYFKLIYGIEASVYTPSIDIFRASDNEWVDTEYLEILHSDQNKYFVGHSIIGSLSRSTAYVERLSRFRKGSKFFDIAFITNRKGDFRVNEQIFTETRDPKITSKIVGSLSELDIVRSDDGFDVGDYVYALDGLGKYAKARVTSIDEFIGIIDFQLIDGGWGYSPYAEILRSERVLVLKDVVVSNTDVYYHNQPFKQFEEIIQPLVQFDTTTDLELFSTNDLVTTANNDFEGKIVNISSETNQIIVSYDDLVYDPNVIGSELELVDANTVISVNNSIDVSATAQVLDTKDTARFTYKLSSGEGLSDSTRIANNAVIYQEETLNNVTREVSNAHVVLEYANLVSNEYFLDIQQKEGWLRNGTKFKVKGDDQNIEYDIVAVSNSEIGIISDTNTFYALGNIRAPLSQTTAMILTNTSYEIPASFTIFETEYEDRRLISSIYNETPLSTANLDLAIDSASYDIGSNLSAGFTSLIGDPLPMEDATVGSIKQIVTTNVGKGYPTDPIFIVHEPRTVHLERYDFKIVYRDDDKNFEIGENIIGQTSGCEAKVRSNDMNSKILYATRINVDDDNYTKNDFVHGELITGERTNITAEIQHVCEDRRSKPSGLNANVFAEAISGTNIATGLEVVNSGYGYTDNERLTFRAIKDPNLQIVAITALQKQGINEGYYSSQRSFLSTNKYLHDSDYYQEYSYVVKTSLPFESYKDSLSRVLHVAGTKPFGSYFSTNISTLDLSTTDESTGFIIS